MSTLEVLGTAAIGYFLGVVQGLISNAYREHYARLERTRLYELGLSQGDPTRLYGLRMADKVTSDARVTEKAVQQELGTTVTAEEAAAADAPWASHPDYADCDVRFDMERGMVYLVNEGAMDGPDIWEEPIDEFMQKFEDPSIPPKGLAVNGHPPVSS